MENSKNLKSILDPENSLSSCAIVSVQFGITL